MESIIAAAVSAVIAGGLSLAGVIITVRSNNQKLIAEIKAEQAKAQAVTDIRLDELTREVRKHNGFAERMPVVENEVKWMKDKMEYFHHAD